MSTSTAGAMRVGFRSVDGTRIRYTESDAFHAAWVLGPDVDKFRALDPRAVVDTAMRPFAGYGVPDDTRADYWQSYAGDRFVEPIRYARLLPRRAPRARAPTRHDRRTGSDHLGQTGPRRPARQRRVPRRPPARQPAHRRRVRELRVGGGRGEYASIVLERIRGLRS